MGSTPDYTKRAIEKYNQSKDRTSVILPKGTLDRIKATGEKSANSLINRLVLQYLEEYESKNENGSDCPFQNY